MPDEEVGSLIAPKGGSGFEPDPEAYTRNPHFKTGTGYPAKLTGIERCVKQGYQGAADKDGWRFILAMHEEVDGKIVRRKWINKEGETIPSEKRNVNAQTLDHRATARKRWWNAITDHLFAAADRVSGVPMDCLIGNWCQIYFEPSKWVKDNVEIEFDKIVMVVPMTDEQFEMLGGTREAQQQRILAKIPAEVLKTYNMEAEVAALGITPETAGPELADFGLDDDVPF